MLVVWRSGGAVGSIDCCLTSNPVTTEMGNRLSSRANDPGPLSLAIPPWAGEMTTDDGLGHRQEKNSEVKFQVMQKKTRPCSKQFRKTG